MPDRAPAIIIWTLILCTIPTMAGSGWLAWRWASSAVECNE